jgi:hypothetical protein
VEIPIDLQIMHNPVTPVKLIKREDNDIFGSKSPKKGEPEIFATSYNS